MPASLPPRPPAFQAHPWHGVSPGARAPHELVCYVEMVPTDTVKYEVDKETGLLRLDRPQRYSSQPPCLYGFVPRSYCHVRVGTRCAQRTRRHVIVGDGDPMDVCILTEKQIPHGAILVRAIPIGGLRMVDHEQADDKIVAVLEGDAVYGGWRDVTQVPSALLDRLRHYFLTYKTMPGAPPPEVEIAEIYDAAEARATLEASFEDYRASFPA